MLRSLFEICGFSVYFIDISLSVHRLKKNLNVQGGKKQWDILFFVLFIFRNSF